MIRLIWIRCTYFPGFLGDWEVLQFEKAELVAQKTYELSGLLRGQGGTELFMNGTISPGARFVLLDEAVVQADMSPDEVGLDFRWKYGPANLSIDDPSYLDQVHAFSGLGLKPLRPAHVRGVLDPGTNDLILSWVRRTRIGGDSWDTLEVPLGEDEEAYEVEILDGSSVIRTLSSNLPRITYFHADQIADWGAAQSSYQIRLYQLSASYGRGHAREVIVNV